MTLKSIEQANKLNYDEVLQLQLKNEVINWRDLVAFINLETLILENCIFQNIENKSILFSKVKNLSIINTKEPEVINKFLIFFPNINSINLSDNGLNQMPPTIKDLKKLKIINLANNNISKIMYEITDFEIEYLNLSNNQLKEIPESIINLTTLKTLVLDNNHLKSLILPFMYDSYLKMLICYNNEIEDFYISPKVFQLESLYLDSNDLRFIPKCISQLKSLKILSLGFNDKIKTLPDWLFENNDNLEELNIANIGLVELNNNFQKLTKLLTLNLSNNRLSNVSDNIYHINSLQDLDLSLNRINNISNKIAQLKNLKRLNLGYNELSDFPIFSSNALELIDLSNNKFLNETKSLILNRFANCNIII